MRNLHENDFNVLREWIANGRRLAPTPQTDYKAKYIDQTCTAQAHREPH